MFCIAQSAENALTISVFQLFFTEVGGDDGSFTLSYPFVQNELEIFKGDVFQHRLCAQVVNDQKVCGEGVVKHSFLVLDGGKMGVETGGVELVCGEHQCTFASFKDGFACDCRCKTAFACAGCAGEDEDIFGDGRIFCHVFLGILVQLFQGFALNFIHTASVAVLKGEGSTREDVAFLCKGDDILLFHAGAEFAVVEACVIATITKGSVFKVTFLVAVFGQSVDVGVTCHFDSFAVTSFDTVKLCL